MCMCVCVCVLVWCDLLHRSMHMCMCAYMFDFACGTVLLTNLFPCDIFVEISQNQCKENVLFLNGRCTVQLSDSYF